MTWLLPAKRRHKSLRAERIYQSNPLPDGEELEDDNLSILDLENIILTGQIKERQRDVETREVKYVIAGVTLDGAAAEVVVKVGFGGWLVVITVHLW